MEIQHFNKSIQLKYFDVYRKTSETDFFAIGCPKFKNSKDYIKIKDNFVFDQKEFDNNLNEFYDEKAVLFHTKLKCAKETIATVLSYFPGSAQRVWLNKKIIRHSKFGEYLVNKVRLKKGVNDIVFLLEKDVGKFNFSIRIADIDETINGINFTEDNNYFKRSINSISFFVDSGVICNNSNIFKFKLLQNDFVDFNEDSNIDVKITDAYGNKYKYPAIGKINKVISIDLRAFNDLKTKEKAYIYLDATCKHKGKTVGKLFLITLGSADNYRENILNKIKNCGILNCNDELYKSNIIGRMEDMEATDNYMCFCKCIDIERILERFNKQLPFFNFDENSRSYEYFYISKLDKSARLIPLKLPKNYDPKKKYPLVLHIPVGLYSYYPFSFDADCDNDVILASVTQRGVTVGNPISEASIIEQIQLISEILSVDEKKIFLIGHSSGAYAALTFLQKHPESFAGAMVSGGAMRYDEVDSRNIPTIYDFSSPADFALNELLKRKELLWGKSDYHFYIYDDFMHSNTFVMLYSESCFSEMIKRSSKGTVIKEPKANDSLMDVYLKPLVIYTDKKCKELVETAKKFANPKASTFDPEISVNYPIEDIGNLCDLNTNAIIIDNNSGNENIKNIIKAADERDRKKLNDIKSVFFDREYVILKNIKYKNNLILYIFTNNIRMLNSCIFTRRIVLSSYSSGKHIYLSNNFLIYSDKTFYDDKIRKITAE